MTSRPAATSSPTESATIRRFSSPLVRKARSTCAGSDFATMVITGAPESSRPRSCGSFSAAVPGWQVEPKATSLAVARLSSLAARAKNSVSLGMAPGQPASIYVTPRWSRIRATASLSSTVKETDCCWAPSRSVVS